VRLKRAALVALGGTLTVACGAKVEPTMVFADAYGGPPLFDASTDAENLSDAASGGAAVWDSGPDFSDAADDSTLGVDSAYGGPVWFVEDSGPVIDSGPDAMGAAEGGTPTDAGGQADAEGDR
jgi:hypothetical protein